MSRHRAQPVRPRWGRVALAAAAATVTGVALVGGLSGAASQDGDVRRAVDPAVGQADAPLAAPAADAAADAGVQAPRTVVSGSTLHRDKALPDASGTGRRVVFSESRQRVWLVGDSDDVERTYLVSGSVYDNLDPGSYEVYSRSEDAVGVDDSGTMQWFVRFTQGDNAAIGFHDIPVDDGTPVQSTDQLGTPLSHGCIRQKESDALALWDFAPLGTSVVVTA